MLTTRNLLHSSNRLIEVSWVQLIQNLRIAGPCCLQAVGHSGASARDAHVQSLALVDASGSLRYIKVPDLNGNYTEQVYTATQDSQTVAVLATSMHLVSPDAEVPLFGSALTTEFRQTPSTTVALVRSASSSFRRAGTPPIWMLKPEEVEAALAGASKEEEQKLLSGIDDYGRTPLVPPSTGKKLYHIFETPRQHLGRSQTGVYEPAWRLAYMTIQATQSRHNLPING